MSNPHYFIAIPLPLELKEYFSKWQTDLKQTLNYKEWPNKHDLHITLKFLGGSSKIQLRTLHDKLTLLQVPTFSITVGQIGTFGQIDQPRVLWAGVEKNELITTLQKDVEQCAVQSGFSREERTYLPHITLGKKWVGSKDPMNLDKIKKAYKNREQKLTVDSISLYQIYPFKSPKYAEIYRYRINGGVQNGTVD